MGQTQFCVSCSCPLIPSTRSDIMVVEKEMGKEGENVDEERKECRGRTVLGGGDEEIRSHIKMLPEMSSVAHRE